MLTVGRNVVQQRRGVGRAFDAPATQAPILHPSKPRDNSLLHELTQTAVSSLPKTDQENSRNVS